MKMMFASDVHGSLYSAEILIERIYAEKPDFVMFLGDFCGYNENAIFGEVFGKITCPYSYVMGNCDNMDTIKRFGFCPTTLFSVEEYGNRMVFGTHGHVYYQNNIPIELQKGDIYVSGHTHIPSICHNNGINYINCGSMARPRANDIKTYALLHDKNIYIKSDEGDIIKQGTLV